MILGRSIHPASACFDELEAALVALGRPDVILNGHAFPTQIPPGSTIYQTENVGTQVTVDMFQGCEIWDMFASNVAKWEAAGRKAVHVPLGYHPSMKTFEMRPWEERDVDVVFTGVVNERRAWVLDELRAKGLKVCVIGPGAEYGAERNAVLARSKLALNMTHADDVAFPVLRAAHGAANGLPMLNEHADEMPDWVDYHCAFEDIADRVESQLARGESTRVAERTLEAFLKHPMKLPDPWWFVREPWGNEPLEQPNLESMYERHRGGPVSPTPLVCVVMPTYRETERVARMSRDSRNKVRTHMAENGINNFVLHLADDSLVCRMRQIACHHFLASAATHMLFWDADITARDVDCVTQMLAAKLPVVAGACPFKDTTGRTVHNLFPEMQRHIAEKKPLELPNGCIEVRDAGSGFMLIERATLIALQQAHPELLHWSKREGFPLWALFDTAVVDGEYLSEDYRFCRLWQQHGGKVHVYVPARFTHYGEHGFEASFMEQYNLGVPL